MEQIFISHSQRDTEIRDYFLKIFGISDLKARVVEFEGYDVPPWEYIKEEIKKSKAVFLLLGNNVIDRGIYTQNWISFEIGLACQMKKPIWVFEPKGTEIRFPVPYLDYYFLYELDEGENLKKIREIIEGYRDIPFRLPKGFLNLKCLHEGCGISYKFYSSSKLRGYRCPTCRKPFRIF